MNAKKDEVENPSAFPLPDPEGVNWPINNGYAGMTLRDYFAIHANIGEATAWGEARATGMLDLAMYNEARLRYEYADAMLKARIRE